MLTRLFYNSINFFKRSLAFPAIVLLYFSEDFTKELVRKDIEVMNIRCGQNQGLTYYLAFRTPYRNLFYYRLGRKSKFLEIILRPYPMFTISSRKIGGGMFCLNHPFSSIINAKEIGKNFTLCHLTTIGNAMHGRNDLVPTIGDNVSLGANVTIIGNIKIGNNVIVGAGSVVVKDVPENCVVAGNPARIIRYL